MKLDPQVVGSGPATAVQTHVEKRLDETIGVLGLGYVGLPVMLALARVFEEVSGFDTSTARIRDLQQGLDKNGDSSASDLLSTSARLSGDPQDLDSCSFYVVTVPTPIDQAKRPNFAPLLAACATIGPHLRAGNVVVFESTVYPGATEEVCGPALEAASGLRAGHDFFLGYSPERIDPGSPQHRLETIVKVVAGQTPAAVERIASVYASVVKAGIFRASSIKVAEAAKVIENTQRDLNIALMNELALIFDRLDIPTRDVLEAASTKWNFLPFQPGLVGGHCIGVDPYYLTAKADAVGYHSEVILAGRRINDAMGRHVAQKTLKLLSGLGVGSSAARVAVLGLTFKPNVPDLRNSKTADLVDELRAFGCQPLLHDPCADHAETAELYGELPVPLTALEGLDALILAVPHEAYLADHPRLLATIRTGGLLVDLKAAIARDAIRGCRPDLSLWSM